MVFFGYVSDVVDLGLDYLKVVGLCWWDFVGIVGYALYAWLEVPIGCRWECGVVVMFPIVRLMRWWAIRSFFFHCFVIYVVGSCIVILFVR